MALEATEGDSFDNVPAYKVWLNKIKCLWTDSYNTSPRVKSQMLTIAESQLNSSFPGEELSSCWKNLGFSWYEKGEILSLREGQYCRRFGSCKSKLCFCHCEKTEAEKFIQVTSIYILVLHLRIQKLNGEENLG